MNLKNKEKMNMRKMNVKIITHLIYVAPINATTSKRCFYVDYNESIALFLRKNYQKDEL